MTKRWMAALLTTALVLTSCGGSKQETSLELVQGAGAAVLAQKTAKVEMRFEGAGQGFTMTGQLDFEHSSGSFEMEVPVLGKVEIVNSGASLYVQAGGAGWTEIKMTGDLADQALQGFGADPRTLLEQMSTAEGITEVGTEDIRGMSTTHYRGELDFMKALEAQGTPKEQIDEILKQAGSADKLTSTIDVYIDSDGLAHRTVSVTKLAGLFETTMTMDMLDFGKPVTITVPPASDVERTESASSQFEVNQLVQQIFVTG